MSCKISFIEDSSLSQKDKDRFEIEYDQIPNGLTPVEYAKAEQDIKDKFFDSGYFTNDENHNYFVYDEKYFPYVIQEENIITSAPKDISNYILKNYNQVKKTNGERIDLTTETLKAPNVLWGVVQTNKSTGALQFEQSPTPYRVGRDSALESTIRNRSFTEIWNDTSIVDGDKRNLLYASIIGKIQEGEINNRLTSYINRHLGGVHFHIIANKDLPEFFVYNKIIYLNYGLYDAYKKINPENIEAFIKSAISEELIHIIANSMMVTQDYIDILNETPEEGFKALNIKYPLLRPSNPRLAVDEYVRMAIQDKLTGSTTEQIKNTFGGKIAEIIEKAWKTILDWLNSNSNLRINTLTKEIIDRINNNISYQDTINNNVLPSDISVSQQIANIDNMVSFDMNELSFLTDLLKEINPEFDIKYVEDLMLKQGRWGYADIEHFKAILDKRADKAFVSEEFCHLLLEAYNDKPLLREIGDMMIHTKLYQEQIKDYINNPRYQKDGKPWMEKIKREFVGKALGYIIAGRSMEDIIGKHPQTKGLIGMLRNLWEKIKVLFTGKLDDKLMAVLSDIKNRRGFDMESITEFSNEIFDASGGSGIMIHPSLIIDFNSDNEYHFDTNLLIKDNGELTDIGKVLISVYNNFNNPNLDRSTINRLIEKFRGRIKIYDYDGLIENVKSSGLKAKLRELLTSPYGLTFNNPDHATNYTFFGIERSVKVQGVDTPIPAASELLTDFSDEAMAGIKTNVINYIRSLEPKETKTQEFTSTFTTETFADLSGYIADLVDKLYGNGNSLKMINNLTSDNRHHLTENTIRQVRSLINAKKDITSMAVLEQFFKSLNILYDDLQQLTEDLFDDRLDPKQKEHIFGTLNRYKEINKSLNKLVNAYSDQLKRIKASDPGLASVADRILGDMNRLVGMSDSFDKLLKVVTINKIVDQIMEELVPLETQIVNKLETLNQALAQNPNDRNILAEIASLQAMRIGNGMTPDIKDGLRASLRAVLLGLQADPNMPGVKGNSKEIRDRLKEIEGYNLSGVGKVFDLYFLDGTNSLDYFVQAVSKIINANKNKALFELQDAQILMESIRSIMQELGDEEVFKSITYVKKNKEGKDEVFFADKHAKDYEAMDQFNDILNALVSEKKILDNEIAASNEDTEGYEELVSKLKDVEFKIARVSFSRSEYQDMNFYDRNTEEIHIAKMNLRKRIQEHYNLTDAQLEDLLFEEYYDRNKILKETQFDRSVLHNAINEERYLAASKDFLRNKEERSRRFKESSDSNERFKFIRELNFEFDNTYKEDGFEIATYISKVSERASSTDLFDVDKRRINQILEGSITTLEDQMAILFNLHSYTKEVIATRNYTPDVKNNVHQFITFIDTTISITGNQKFYEERAEIIANMSLLNARLNPNQFYQVSKYEAGSKTIKVLGKDEVIDYITIDEYMSLSEKERRKVTHYIQKVQTIDGEQILIRNIKRNNFLSKGDISGYWQQIIDLVKDKRLPSGEIYLDPANQDDMFIRSQIYDLEQLIEDEKESLKVKHDNESLSEEYKNVKDQLFRAFESFAKLQKDNHSTYYYVEALDLIKKEGINDPTWKSLAYTRNQEIFKINLSKQLSDESYLKTLYDTNGSDVDKLFPIDQWIKKNHIITEYTKTSKEGNTTIHYRIKPVYYFRKVLPIKRSDQKARLSDIYNVKDYKDAFKIHNMTRESHPERYDVFGKLGSRGYNPDDKYKEIYEDNSPKGKKIQKIYEVLYEQIHLGEQKKSINRNGKIYNRVPTLEAFATESPKSFYNYWKRSTIGQRNQFEEGLGDETSTLEQDRKGWLRRTWDKIMQIIIPLKNKLEDSENRTIPVFYTGYKDPSLITHRLYESVFSYLESLKQSDSYVENLAFVTNTVDILKKSDYNLNEHRADKLNNIVKYQIMNNNQNVKGVLGRLMVMIPKLIRFTTQSAFIVDVQVKNLIANFTQNVSSNTTNWKPSIQPPKKALANYMSITKALMSNKTTNKDALIYRYLNPGDVTFMNRFKTENELMEYLATLDILYFPIHIAEKLDNLMDMYRLLEIPVTIGDKEGTLRDAFVVDSTGKLTLRDDILKKDGSVLTMNEVQRLVLAIKQIKSNRTGYQDENTPINANILSRSVFIMARFIIGIVRNHMINAFGGRRRNVVLNELERSRFRDSSKFIIGTISGWLNKYDYGSMVADTGERRGYYSVLTTILYSGLAYLLMGILGYSPYDDDDDDDKWDWVEEENSNFKQFLITTLIKYNAELESGFVTVNPNYIPSIIIDQRFNKPRDYVPVITENLSLIQRNLYMNFLFKDMAQFMSGVLLGSEFRSDDYLDRWEAGDNKTAAFIYKINPYHMLIDRYEDAEKIGKKIESLDISR